MKKALIIIPFLFAFSTDTITVKKSDAAQAVQTISSIYQYIDKSNLPHQDVVQMEAGLKKVYELLADSSEKK